MKITLNLMIICICLIKVNKNTSLIKAFRMLEVDGLRTIFTLANENVTLDFKKDTPTNYCKFIHPNGTTYSTSDDNLNSENCSIEIEATSNNTGIWHCHMRREADNQVIKKLNLRVVGQLAAVNKIIVALLGAPVILACVTVKVLTPVRYCEFQPPASSRFSINESATIFNQIKERYYFPENMTFEAGYCAVTIHKTVREDNGPWTCKAILYDGRKYSDKMRLYVKNDKMSAAEGIIRLVFTFIGTVILMMFCISILVLTRDVRTAPENIELYDYLQR